MSDVQQTCRSQRRRQLVRRAGLNGIDSVDVSEEQLTLTITFLEKAPDEIGPENVRIDGGRRVTGIQVVGVRLCREEDADLDDCMIVTVDRPGDFSTYTLRLVEPDARGRPGAEPLEGFDPRYAQIDFSFKVNCPSDLDCAQVDSCPPPALVEPEIDYLARDYASFRQLIFDRLALIMPEWRERNIPDLGITLVELLAYVGDYLSYYQDAVATEAYLETARQRRSVRRHVRLIDYQVHEGCNARAWVCVETSERATLKASDYYLITHPSDPFAPEDAAVLHDDLREIAPGSYEVFEPLIGVDVELYPAHNAIRFWTWGDQECCLPRGTTRATLEDGWADAPPPEQPAYEQHSSAADQQAYPPAEPHKPTPPAQPADRPRWLHLRAGDVLIFEELRGPRTGAEADADLAHRQAVRLTSAEPGIDALCGQPIVEIAWAPEDALRFPLCLSAVGGPDCAYLDPVSVAHGNVLLVDHGRGYPRCGEQAEELRVPWVALEERGCEGVGEPLARDRLQVLLRKARSGQALTADEVAEIRAIFGDQAALGAGLATPDPDAAGQPSAGQQVDAIERLLSRYPPIASLGLFSPRISRAPLTQRAPFPALAQLARQQAVRITHILGELRARVEQLWRQAQAGHALRAAEIQELRTIYGDKALTEVGLFAASTRPPRRSGAAEQAAALRLLLARESRYLAKKARRVEVLAARARAGYVLGAPEAEEIGELFGARYAAGLEATNLAYFGPARDALSQDPREALPCLLLSPKPAGQPCPPPPPPDADDVWGPRRDLLASTAQDRHFVAEIDDDGIAHLRFGDGDLGRALAPGDALCAYYRIGNGAAGNVGAEVIVQIVFCATRPVGITRVRNPLPATGGTRPEPLNEIKLFAPATFRRRLQRAITADDYSRLGDGIAGVQRAAAALSWTGSWYEAQVALDPQGGVGLDDWLRDAAYAALHRYRRIGHDLLVGLAGYVPLDIKLEVCVNPHYLRAHVRAALLDAFGNRTLPGGKRGFFHPDNLTFGDSIYLSKLVAVAQALPGVESVQVTRLQRLDEGDRGELDSGLLPLGPLEIARLDNDPGNPENGRLELVLGGGR